MSNRDENTEAVRNVDKATDSEPINGEDLVESEKLKRQFREAKKRLDTLTKAPKTALLRKKQ